MSRRIAIASCIVVVAAVPLASAAFALFLVAEAIVFERSSMPFSQERWQQAQPGSDERYRLANDLIESKALIGMSLEQVQQLLGPAPVSEADNTLAYSVGDRRIFSLGAYLVITFDGDGRATSAAIVRD